MRERVDQNRAQQSVPKVKTPLLSSIGNRFLMIMNKPLQVNLL